MIRKGLLLRHMDAERGNQRLNVKPLFLNGQKQLT
jgi:hypothetical protein